MDQKHSPAPWKRGDAVWLEDPIYHTAGGQRYVPLRDATGTVIALVIADEDDPECPRNIAVVEAAPKMLAALEQVAPILKDLGALDGATTFDQADAAEAAVRTAITAATGGKP